MKKNALYTALLVLTPSWPLYAMGLGEMTIESSLNQPFLAKIKMLDVGSIPLAGIKIGVAAPDYFEQLGFQPLAVFSQLQFKVQKNAQGEFIILIKSQERMIEPYMELVVDLTWPQGQLYKAYTVLLDPPGYQLVSSKAQNTTTHYHKKFSSSIELGVIDKPILTSVQNDVNTVDIKYRKEQSSYGPTLSNENVWQIAQHYKTAELILPQVVLAIVGANPDKFKEGNLNGLQTGVHLTIPSTLEMTEVPAELATQEVMAHDSAWNEKKSLTHVLIPPYKHAVSFNTQINYSEIPAIPQPLGIPETSTAYKPVFNDSAGVSGADIVPSINKALSAHTEQDATVKMELSITAAAIESVRESNAVLMEQLHLLQEQNKALQVKLAKKTQKITALNTQMQFILKQREGVVSQANSAAGMQRISNPWWLLLLFSALGGAAFAYWYVIMKNREDENQGSQEENLGDNFTKPYFITPSSHTTVEEDKIFAPFSLADSTDNQNKKLDESDKIDKEHISPNATKVKTEDKADVTETIAPAPVFVPALEENKPLYKEDPEAKHSPEKESIENEKQVIAQDLPPTTSSDAVQTSIPTDAAITAPAEVKKSTDTNIDVENCLEFEPGLYQSFASSPEKNDSAKDLDIDKTVFDLEKVDFNPIPVQEKIWEEDELDPVLSDFFAEKEKEEARQSNSLEKQLQTSGKEQKLPDDKQPQENQDNTANLKPRPSKEAVDTPSNSISSHKPLSSAAPLKSKVALDTLFSLAKTYIGMGDVDSAVTSLEEVLEYGTQEQKTAAQQLLDEIKHK